MRRRLINEALVRVTRMFGVLGILLIPLAGLSASGQEKQEWGKIVANARKEGKVVVYGTSSFRPMVKEIEDTFLKKFGIKIEYLIGRSREVRERIRTEVRTNRPVGDVAQAGATSLPALWQDGGLETWLPPSIGVVRPEVAESMDLPKMPITPLYANLRGILINTNLVRPEDAPKSWKDLADPKWRGKILMDDPRSAGAGNSLFVSTLRHPNLSKEFHEKLAENKPVFVGAGTYQQIATRVAQGEYAIGFPVDADAIVDLKGAPVKWIAPKEGVTYTIMGIGLAKNAARPNAAKVFINFTLSKEFQRIAGQSGSPIRPGVPAGRQEWSLDRASLLPRPIAESRKEREEYYRLVESIYGIR